MKISWFKKDITPEIGTKISGYAMEDVSFSQWSPLLMTGLLADDGEQQVLLVRFDLQCMDVEYIRKFRKECGEILGIPAESVMLSFTHTHGGPQTNSEARYADHLNIPYLNFLEHALLEACRELVNSEMEECNVFFYSAAVDDNINRRVTTADNYASFLPHNEELRQLANGCRDQELGSLVFCSAHGNQFPVFVIGNYAAHPLAAHSAGLGSRRISADYPAAFRDFVTAETGAECMFVSGACGNMIPKNAELGANAALKMGQHLGEEVLRGILDVKRHPKRFQMKSPKVGALCRTITVPLRRLFCNNPDRLPERDLGKQEIELEIQCLAIGDVCFVGTPGEWCAELGAEVKWHSAFRKTFISYCATSYQDYMCPGNFLLQGGYEALMQHFPARYSIAMVKTAVDATYELKDRLYPAMHEDESWMKVNQFFLRIQGESPDL